VSLCFHRTQCPLSLSSTGLNVLCLYVSIDFNVFCSMLYKTSMSPTFALYKTSMSSAFMLFKDFNIFCFYAFQKLQCLMFYALQDFNVFCLYAFQRLQCLLLLCFSKTSMSSIFTLYKTSMSMSSTFMLDRTPMSSILCFIGLQGRLFGVIGLQCPFVFSVSDRGRTRIT